MRNICWTVCLLVSLLLSMYLWPVPSLRITTPSEQVAFAVLGLLGQRVSTRMVHSVQLTPVEDTYVLVDGSIWSWQEKVQSHNAGLPSVPIPYSIVHYDDPWMIVQGGRFLHDIIYYRVGTSLLGRNEICLQAYCANEDWVGLAHQYAGERLVFSMQEDTLGQNW